MYSSYCNKYLEVDLTKEEFATGTPDERDLERFIGGKGLGLKLLFDMAPKAEPLSPENPLIFLCGPLTGTMVTTSARSCLVTRSPLTGGFLDSHAGGDWGPAMKRCGYDYIVLKGRASSPVYISLSSEGKPEFHDAGGLWGKGIFDTERELIDKHGKCQVASIGPAGEKGVRFACIGTRLYRQFGRGGSGAVMGSKNLKAIVADFSGPRPTYHDDGKFKELNTALTKDVSAHPNRQARDDLGTNMWIRMGQETGGFLPTRNFKDTQFEDYERLTSETMKKELNWKSVSCYNCIIKCSKMATWNGKEVEGPEYETTAYLGSGCGIGDAKTVAEANRLCDDLGLDTISTGVTTSFAMEAYEKGVLDTGGLELKFGNGDALLETIKKIGYREGFGELLGEGTKRAANSIGKGSEYYAINIAGMEVSGVNPKGAMSMALALATADFGSHTRCWSASAEMNGELTLENVNDWIIEEQDNINIRNSLIVCDFLPYGLDRLSPVLNAATGLETTPEDLMLRGQRIHNLARWFNIINCRTRADDTVPPRFFEEEMESGLLKGKKMGRELFEKLKDEYYQKRGWDDNGVPTREKLEELGLREYKIIK